MPSDVNRFAYNHLRKLMGNKESKNIVRHTRHDNALEAYRLLHEKYNPNTAAQRSVWYIMKSHERTASQMRPTAATPKMRS